MKCIIFLLLAFSCIKANGQVYKYYFLEFRATGKLEVEIKPEDDAEYSDIESLIVSKRDTSKNGRVNIVGKKYKSFSNAFNALSASGLEFKEFVTLNIVGGATGILAGPLPVNYMIWRKKIRD